MLKSIKYRLNKLIKILIFRLRILDVEKRISPSFIIVGVQRGGTSSLYNYLIQHPLICHPLKKEIHYFDLNYKKGSKWYLANFNKKYTNSKMISGEATPYYMFHPLAIKRIKKDFPDIKIIIVLRNPMERTISHYKHEVRLKREKRSIKDVVLNYKFERDIITNEEKKIIDGKNYNSYYHQRISYLSRSIYFNQVQKIFNLFGKEKTFIIQSEELFNKPKETYDKVILYLNLPKYTPDNFKVFNASNLNIKITDEIRSNLDSYFKQYNEKLEQLVSKKFNW